MTEQKQYLKIDIFSPSLCCSVMLPSVRKLREFTSLAGLWAEHSERGDVGDVVCQQGRLSVVEVFLLNV